MSKAGMDYLSIHSSVVCFFSIAQVHNYFFLISLFYLYEQHEYLFYVMLHDHQSM